MNINNRLYIYIYILYNWYTALISIETYHITTEIFISKYSYAYFIFTLWRQPTMTTDLYILLITTYRQPYTFKNLITSYFKNFDYRFKWWYIPWRAKLLSRLAYWSYRDNSMIRTRRAKWLSGFTKNRRSSTFTTKLIENVSRKYLHNKN